MTDLLLEAILCIIGRQGEHWINQLPVYDDYTDPEIGHQN